MGQAARAVSDEANFDDGDMWPVGWAIKKLTPADEKLIAQLVGRGLRAIFLTARRRTSLGSSTLAPARSPAVNQLWEALLLDAPGRPLARIGFCRFGFCNVLCGPRPVAFRGGQGEVRRLGRLQCRSLRPICGGLRLAWARPRRYLDLVGGFFGMGCRDERHLGDLLVAACAAAVSRPADRQSASSSGCRRVAWDRP